MPIGSTHSGSNAAKSATRHGAAVRARMRRGRGGDLAAVERLAARRGDRLQRARRGREREALADLGRPAVRQEGLGPARHRLPSSGVAATHFCWTTIGTA